MNTLSNDQLTIQINPLGAELSSIVTLDDNKEYLWQGGPGFWNGRSPVLFPIIGRLSNNEYRYKDKTYKMEQHGFARRKPFELIRNTAHQLIYKLTDDEKIRENYPFHFSLFIGYKLIGREIEVSWKVQNNGNDDMYFQIGAHPGFYYSDLDPADNLRGYFAFNNHKDIKYKLLHPENGCLMDQEYPVEFQNGLMPITTSTFNKDALILENSQIQKVSLIDKHQKPYVSLLFNAPVLGLWSPGSESPFVCIEPWYGRCDKIDFTGELKERDWIQHLEAGSVFETRYFITIE